MTANQPVEDTGQLALRSHGSLPERITHSPVNTSRPENEEQMTHKKPTSPTSDSTRPKVSTCTDWYHEGESREVEVNGLILTVRFVARRGRRARITIMAPPGAMFRGVEKPC